ncbi:MAG TPA: hypothetical protein VE912_14885 [Bacteroidales bacterium]|nr:hypothetical protein [Bacteroidales bacterium]
MIRKIFAFRDNFINFYKSQDPKVQVKIEYVLDLVRFEKHVPVKFLKHLERQQEFMKSESLQHLKVFGFFAFLIKEI